MYCSKIGGDCPHPVSTDNEYVFLMMPFQGFNSVYDAIKQAFDGIEGKKFKCDRADEHYTNISIWCDRICKRIRKAKYCIADTTGKNPNVFYELGFAHSMGSTKTIIISQNITDAPFDIKDIGHILYSTDDLPKLRNKIKKAITDLENKENEEGYAHKTSDEVIKDMTSQLREEEKRATGFKEELKESEKREKELKVRIKEIEAIQNNPVEEFKKKITELEKTIAEYKSKLKYKDEESNETIIQLEKSLKEKEKLLINWEKEFENYRSSKDTKPMAKTLLDDKKKKAEAIKWANKAYDESDYNLKIEYYSKAIELDPQYAYAYINRGTVHSHLKEHQKAIADYNKAIELDTQKVLAYIYRGTVYSRLKEHQKAIADYNKAIELDTQNASAYLNLAELKIINGKYEDAAKVITMATQYAQDIEDKAVQLYLACIAGRILNMDISQSEKEFNDLLKEKFTVSWSFVEIEDWLQTADITKAQKKYIIELTQKLKDKK
jgi:tetratricopeptide (TPR) repeat protein